MFDDKSHGRNPAVKREIARHKTAFGNDFQARSRNRRDGRHGQMDLSKAKHYMRNQSAIKTFRFEMDLAGGISPAVSQAI